MGDSLSYLDYLLLLSIIMFIYRLKLSCSVSEGKGKIVISVLGQER